MMLKSTSLLSILILVSTATHAARHESAAQPVVPTPVTFIYRPEYNIPGSKLLSLIASLAHSFNGWKYDEAFKYIQQRGLITQPVIRPEKVTEEQLQFIHTPEYLASLQEPSNVAKIVEVPPLGLIRNSIIQRYVLDPMRYATQGTIDGAQRAMATGGVVFNLGGGYHHAKAEKGEGFCVYNDVMLAIAKLRQTHNSRLKVMIVDLDAHQGNGNASVLGSSRCKEDPNIAIFDMYNEDVYPGRLEHAQQAAYITYNKPLSGEITTDGYMNRLGRELPRAVNEFQPDLLIYNAGTDILDGDRVGRMKVNRQDVIARDAFVIDTARRTGLPGKAIPVLVVTSGGYTKESAGIIGESFANITSHLTGKPLQQPSWFAANSGKVSLAVGTGVVVAAVAWWWHRTKTNKAQNAQHGIV